VLLLRLLVAVPECNSHLVQGIGVSQLAEVSCNADFDLANAGERLSRGWVPLLRLLAAVPERGGTDAIKLGFQSVELMCSDYMASLPTEQLRRCLEIAALYASQQVSRATLMLQPAPAAAGMPRCVTRMAGLSLFEWQQCASSAQLRSCL